MYSFKKHFFSWTYFSSFLALGPLNILFFLWFSSVYHYCNIISQLSICLSLSFSLSFSFTLFRDHFRTPKQLHSSFLIIFFFFLIQLSPIPVSMCNILLTFSICSLSGLYFRLWDFPFSLSKHSLIVLAVSVYTFLNMANDFFFPFQAVQYDVNRQRKVT